MSEAFILYCIDLTHTVPILKRYHMKAVTLTDAQVYVYIYYLI